MGFTYTADQQKVIDLRDRNILVSAAAGSGKTAVLVERIITMISDKENPVDIDRLLIVTFTNAAAAEMRERISVAIHRKMEQDPDNIHLQKQTTLIHNAQITTIDSFCLFVIRNNFNEIGLDPGFRIGDEGECKLLKQDVLKEVLEANFAKEDREDFIRLVEAFGGNGKERALEEKILQLYEFSMSFPWPKQWITERKEDYHVENVEELNTVWWIEELCKMVKTSLMDVMMRLEACIGLCQDVDGPISYLPALESDFDMVRQIQKSTSIEGLYHGFASISHQALSRKKDPDVDPDKKEMVKGLRDEIKDGLKDIKNKYFQTPLELVFVQMKHIDQVMNALLDVVLEYAEAFEQKKREKNIIDFHDMEHFALQILVNQENNQATQVALDYRAYFHEIMIDEYQDSNMVQEYLLKSISGEEEGRFNRFMVGDVKQSIYKFRLARPEIFLEKFDTYSDEDGEKQRIDLHKNFRSRKEVIEGVNYFFHQIMEQDLGNVTYDEKAALFQGATYPDAEDRETELLLIEPGETYSQREVEAKAVANKISDMVGSFQVTDKESGALRKATYKDIVILLRSNAGWDEVFKKALEEAGIPVYISSKTGYFSSTEIQAIMNYLRVVDNPRQDIPLYGAMRSFFGGFEEEEIAEIKASGDGTLYENLCSVAGFGETDEIGEGQKNADHCDGKVIDNKKIIQKSMSFIERLQRYRKKVSYEPIHDLLQQLLEETSYLQYVSALPGGDQRYANVNMLMAKAIAFEQTSYFGLFHFIRYMEQIEKYDIDYGEANISDEQADTVRIMSIHKSKGLEFPICFVSGMSKRINQMDANQNFVMDMDFGIGMDYMNGETRVKSPNLRKAVISHKMKMDNLGEELRIFYVALTRAKEKLIMTGVVEKLDEKIKKLLYLSSLENKVLPLGVRNSAACYMDYVLASLIRQVQFGEFLNERGIFRNPNEKNMIDGVKLKIVGLTENQIVASSVKAGMEKEYTRMTLEEQKKNVDEVLYHELKEKTSFVYSHENLQELCTKTTVTELKKASMVEAHEPCATLFPEEEIVPYIPHFMKEEEEQGGVVRGNAYHKVLENISLDVIENENDCRKQIQELLEKGKISKEYEKLIRIETVMKFVNSEIGTRMAKAQKQGLLWREQPFVLGIEANRLQNQFPAEELVLMQGIIDAYFIENDELVIVDYKTDRVSTPQTLVERYKVQLDYYEEALERIVGKRVKEKVIYSFGLGKSIVV